MGMRIGISFPRQPCLEEVDTEGWITVLDQSGGLVAISTKFYEILVYLYIVFRIWWLLDPDSRSRSKLILPTELIEW